MNQSGNAAVSAPARCWLTAVAGISFARKLLNSGNERRDSSRSATHWEDVKSRQPPLQISTFGGGSERDSYGIRGTNSVNQESASG